MPRIRTGYSFRTAVGGLSGVMERLKAVGMPFAPITDRASTFGWRRWSELAAAQGLKPVFGVELGVSPDPTAKRPRVDHWTFFATHSVEGVNRLLELATMQFRYQPLLTYEQALRAEGVWRMVGHTADLELLGRCGVSPGTYLGLSPACAPGYIRAALGMGMRAVATSDNRYTLPAQRGLYEVVCGRNADTHSYDQHIQTAPEWLRSVEWRVDDPEIAHRALQFRNDLLQRCTASLERATLIAPERPATLSEMCHAGSKRLGVDLSVGRYAERLKRELELIHEKRYEDYFYLLADLCSWARERMVVGPARGSSCGSLVCYLLGITTVDPLEHGLIFERFIDINRSDLPDIDVDFSDNRRHLVFKYLNDTYGAERVARLGAVSGYKPRAAINEAGTALSVPRSRCESLLHSLLERSSGDSRALNSLEDTLRTTPEGQRMLEDYPEIIVAAEMEGHPRHYTQHAAGVVVAQEPVRRYVALDARTGAAQCDKKDAEALNLLKIDALGLTQLSVFEDALGELGLPHDYLEGLPLTDEAAFGVLNDGRFAGVFQFNGIALQSICAQFRVERFEDIVHITALGRPGPLASGGAHEWVRRRNGFAPVTYPHPVFEPHLSDTLGVVLYQEQVMNIGRDIGGLSWGDVTALRKAMSKSLGKEYFDQFGDPWKRGAIAKGVSPEQADRVWDDLCAYGSWSFNKSHSVAYGMISYWCCWLKAHHPYEFSAATLTHESDPDRQIELLRELKAEGIDYVPVDPQHSTDRWRVHAPSPGGPKLLLGPLQNIHGLGPKGVRAVLSARRRNEPLPTGVAKKLASPRTTIDSLYPIRDAFRRLLPCPGDRNIHTPPTRIADAGALPNGTVVLLLCTFAKINPRDENEAVVVARRGYEITDGSPTQSLNLQLRDDSGLLFGKVDRWLFPAHGPGILNRGRAGKALYAVKGEVRGSDTFRMLKVQMVRYIGDLAA